MAVQIQTRRSSTLNDRPFPTRLGAGELALNNHSTSPGLFFADNVASPSTGLIKVGPVHIGSTAPNSSAAGFTSSTDQSGTSIPVIECLVVFCIVARISWFPVL